MPRAPPAVADNEGVAIGIAFGGVCFQVGRDLPLQGCEEHAVGTLPGDLIEHGSSVSLVLR